MVPHQYFTTLTLTVIFHLQMFKFYYIMLSCYPIHTCFIRSNKRVGCKKIFIPLIDSHAILFTHGKFL